ncbi:MAG: hypothetical protein OEZ43_17950 [Gammaproteobacteria bacterium]|nr:hypothetical protein [Gammaproteobacteria bacterium]
MGSELFRYTVLPFVIFVLLMVGVSAGLQQTLLIYKLGGAYTHWAVILLGLPVLIGLLLRILETSQPLVVTFLAAVASTGALYFLYKTYFWAQAPSILNALFFFVVIVGGAHLPYSRGPIERFFGALVYMIRPTPKKRTRAPAKKVAAGNTGASSSMIPMIEMTVGIASLALSVYSIAFMGKA